MFIDLRERKGERVRERVTSNSCLLYIPQPGIKPAIFWSNEMSYLTKAVCNLDQMSMSSWVEL